MIQRFDYDNKFDNTLVVNVMKYGGGIVVTCFRKVIEL